MNLKHNYELMGIKIDNVIFHKDLGINVTCDLSSNLKCNSSASKANRVLGIISRPIKHKTKDNIMLLYNLIVRPNLEYGVKLRSLQYKKAN